MPLKFKPIKFGASGPAILDISKLLANSGSSIKPTSEFGIGMLSAIKAFQKRNGIPVTGIIDKKTWDKLVTFKPVKKLRKK